MQVAAATGDNISLWIHISATVIGLGATFAEALLFPVATRMGARYLPLVHQLQIAINRFLATPALVVILATGFFQVSNGNWSFGDAWISATFAIVIALGGLLGGYFIPAYKRLRTMVERDIAAGDRQHGRCLLTGGARPGPVRRARPRPSSPRDPPLPGAAIHRRPARPDRYTPSEPAAPGGRGLRTAAQ